MKTEEKTVKLSAAGSLRSFIKTVIEEGIKSTLAQKALSEKENQAKHSRPMQEDEDESSGDSDDDLFGTGGGGDSEDGGDMGGGDEEGDSSSSKTMDDESDKLSQGDIEPKDIVDRLNAIRSGKSFKDEHVGGAMEDYINSLSKAEKVALLAFLKGIAQIVTGEVSGDQAEEPSDNPSDVKMQKGDGPKKVKTIKPNVIKKSGGSGGEKKPSGHAEDTSAPAPIVPKRR